MSAPIVPPSASTAHLTEREILLTLFDLGRQVTSVLDLDDLLQKIPDLISRLIVFDAFAVYLFDAKRGELRIGYAVGYPELDPGFRVKVGEGIVGRVIDSQQALVTGDVTLDPGYLAVVPDMASSVAVPLVHKNK